jgi:DNA-binding NarL/FixJ family response regulator
LDYLILTLLSLNFLGVLFIIYKISIQKKSDTQQELNQKLIENLIKIKREMSDLKTFVDQHTRLFQVEMARFRAEQERSPVVASTIEQKVERETLFLNERYKEVFELQDQGLSVSEIAKKLEKGDTEIELILQLAGKRG